MIIVQRAGVSGKTRVREYTDIHTLTAPAVLFTSGRPACLFRAGISLQFGQHYRNSLH